MNPAPVGVGRNIRSAAERGRSPSGVPTNVGADEGNETRTTDYTDKKEERFMPKIVP